MEELKIHLFILIEAAISSLIHDANDGCVSPCSVKLGK